MLNYLRELYTTEGRWSRKKYLMAHLYLLLYVLGVGGIFFLTSFLGDSEPNSIRSVIDSIIGLLLSIGYIFLLVIFIGFVIGIGIIGTIKRLHDLGKSGWWYFITFAPIIQIAFPVYLFIFKGMKGPNKYGSDPLEEIK